MIIEADDFGANHVISDMCQSHDCRDALFEFKQINPNFKVTLFAIPGEMTQELLDWAKNNKDWVELAVHGFYHSSNYECEKMSYEEFHGLVTDFEDVLDEYFVKGFRAPGWQISDEIYQWLLDNDWWVADQSYNDHRRPRELKAYVNDNGVFSAHGIQQDGHHFHTWNCVGNGVYEMHDQIMGLISGETNFRTVGETIRSCYVDRE